jgi:hypothetical protein
MRAVEQEADVGVVIGRFQTHELTAGHIELLTEVEKRHPKVIVLLGLSPLMVTTRNPLDFESRKQMIAEQFPDFTILYVKDIPGNDRAWSESLDQIVGDNLTPTQSAMLYGSRDSFVPSYVGRYPTRELLARYVSSFAGRSSLLVIGGPVLFGLQPTSSRKRLPPSMLRSSMTTGPSSCLLAKSTKSCTASLAGSLPLSLPASKQMLDVRCRKRPRLRSRILSM